MNWIDAYRDGKVIRRLADNIGKYDGKPLKFMEVCGTHTMAIAKYGVQTLLPTKIKLISGPGCPVCVTSSFFVNASIDLARRQGFIIATFGDMMRIPGDTSTLAEEKAKGADIRVIYSPLDALSIARENPSKQIVLLSVGFETTTPVIALAIIKAQMESLQNFTVLTANKTMPKAMKVLASDSALGIDGFIYPGHVSAITGIDFFTKLSEKYQIPGVVAGFEPWDILSAVAMLTHQSIQAKYNVKNLYRRVVRTQGNPLALAKMNEVFMPCDASWRGIGMIPGSGLTLRHPYEAFDAWKVFALPMRETPEPAGCRCGEILKGQKIPAECELFGTACTPERPVGACMVSSEGACAAFYRYS